MSLRRNQERMKSPVSAVIRQILQSWLALTGTEQKAVVVVLALFLLGLLVKGWRFVH